MLKNLILIEKFIALFLLLAAYRFSTIGMFIIDKMILNDISVSLFHLTKYLNTLECADQLENVNIQLSRIKPYVSWLVLRKVFIIVAAGLDCKQLIITTRKPSRGTSIGAVQSANNPCLPKIFWNCLHWCNLLILSQSLLYLKQQNSK